MDHLSWILIFYFFNSSCGTMVQIAAATGSLSWMSTEWIIRKRPSVLGIVSGALAVLLELKHMTVTKAKPLDLTNFGHRVRRPCGPPRTKAHVTASNYT